MGLSIGKASHGQPPPGLREDIVRWIQDAEVRREAWLRDALGNLAESVAGLGQRIDVQGGGRIPAATESLVGSANAGSARDASSPLPSLPIASEGDAQRLSALPRNPTNFGAVDSCLVSWAQEAKMLTYLTIEDVVARFGFPSRAYVDEDAIMWKYCASDERDGRAGAFILRIVRSRVVEAFAMPK